MTITNLKTISALCILLVITSSCTTTRIATLTKTEQEKIDLYVTKLPERNYVELCYIQTDGAVFHSSQKLLNGLKKKGIELQADAIIDIKYDFQAWYPVASGVAIKYVD